MAVTAVLILAMAGGACVSHKAALSFDQVRGRDWKLTELRVADGRIAVTRDAAVPGDFYTLKFQDDLALGRAAPNNYRAPFDLGNDQGLSFSLIAATLMAPLKEPEALKEDEYFKYLERVYRWDLRDGNLELHTRTGEGLPAILVYAL
jgi:hypothetical protein